MGYSQIQPSIHMQWQREAINGLIEDSILEAEANGVQVLSLGLLNQAWLVGTGLSEEQMTAPKGTIFIPVTHFPPKKMLRDCFYNSTPAILAPKHLENLDSCENWLPRRVMSAWRVAGIVHCMEGWGFHECGNTMFDIERIYFCAYSQMLFVLVPCLDVAFCHVTPA